MNKKILTTKEMKELIDSCSTKTILENDLTELEQQLAQIQSNIGLVKLALQNPETEEEFRKREESRQNTANIVRIHEVEE